MGSINKIEGATATIFFDGVCNLCNSSVNFVIDRDKNRRFSFASLQSEYARSRLAGFDVDPADLESILLLKGEKLYKKSDAALEIARQLSGGWKWLYAFKIVPAFLRDLVYDLIGKNRYRMFGQSDSCRMPTPELKERFLDSYDVA